MALQEAVGGRKAYPLRRDRWSPPRNVVAERIGSTTRMAGLESSVLAGMHVELLRSRGHVPSRVAPAVRAGHRMAGSRPLD